MTPEDLRILRYQLPPFGEGARPSEEMRAFCRFYGIAFTEHRADLEHLAGYVNSGPYRVALHCWRQPQAVANLFIVHGYYDHTGLFSKLVAWGIEQRCNVVIFDLPGHGLSSGEPAVIHDFGDYAQAIHDVLERVRLPELPLWALGQSTGCAALVEYARRFAWPFTAAVFLAPLVRPANWRAVRVAHRTLKPFVRSVRRKFPVNTGDRDFLAFQQRDPLQCTVMPLAWISALGRWLATLEKRDLGVGPVLVIQGDRDATVDWRYNLPYVQALFPKTEVLSLPGAGHQLANETESVRTRYFTRITEYLASKGISLDVNA